MTALGRSRRPAIGQGRRGKPRGWFGSIDVMATQSRSVVSERMIRSTRSGSLNHGALVNLDAPSASACGPRNPGPLSWRNGDEAAAEAGSIGRR